MTYDRDQKSEESEATGKSGDSPSGISRFASLTAGLLARKGEAKPALEPFSNARVAPGSAREMGRGERHKLERRPNNETDAHVASKNGDASHKAPYWELPRTPGADAPADRIDELHSPYAHDSHSSPLRPRRASHHGEGLTGGESETHCPRKSQATRRAAVAVRMTTHDYLRLRLAAAELEVSAHDIVIAALDAYLDEKGVERFDECLCLQKTADKCEAIAETGDDRARS